MGNETINMLDLTDRISMRKTLDGMNTVDIAEMLVELERRDLVRVFRMLSKDKAAEVFAFLGRDQQQSIIEAITDREIANIVDELFLDDAVDFIEEMPAGVVKRVLATVTPDTRNLINLFLQYPEDSAGSIMTIEYIDLKASMTVTDAFTQIRVTGLDKETIYNCYVTDSERRLIGTVSVRTLFLHPGNSLIADIMEPVVIYANTHDDRETLMESFRDNGVIAVPVVDNERRLVGIVTFDDALQVQEEETTEDFEKLAGISPADEPYLKNGIIAMSKDRIPWLFLLNLSVFITGAIVAGYENLLAVLPVLVSFLPMLMDTSGDAGSQSSTLIIRGMATGDIKMTDFSAVIWKEIRVALVCGVVLSAANYLRILLMGFTADIALTVSLAFFSALFLAKTTGALLPFAAKAIKLDPAVMAVPILTTIVDASTLVVYFSLAKSLLQ